MTSALERAEPGQPPFDPFAAGLGPSGRRVRVWDSSCAIDAWGPDLPTCLAEAVRALADDLSTAADAPVVQVLPLAADGGDALDQLHQLLQQVLDALDVLSLVPVRVHLAATGDGGVAGDMEVVPLAGHRPAHLMHGRLDTAASAVTRRPGGWHCRTRVDA